MNETKNLYRVIGCRADSTDAERKSAYRAKMRLVHSDNGGNTDAAQEVNLAWEVLGDPAKHTEYKTARVSWAKQVGAATADSQNVVSSYVVGSGTPARWNASARSTHVPHLPQCSAAPW